MRLEPAHFLVVEQAAGAQQRGEAAIVGGKLVEPAGFDDAALVHEDDAVGVAHGGEPVRDDEGGAAIAQLVDRQLDALLGFDVERAGRFVEHQDRRILEDRAGDGDALALAAGKLRAALADHRIVARAFRQDEVVRRGRHRGGVNAMIVGVGAADADVLFDGAVEQPRILEDAGDRLAQRPARDRARIDAVDQDAPLMRVVDALQQVDERRLAGARRTDDRNRLAGIDLERNVRRRRGRSSERRSRRPRSGRGR